MTTAKYETPSIKLTRAKAEVLAAILPGNIQLLQSHYDLNATGYEKACNPVPVDAHLLKIVLENVKEVLEYYNSLDVDKKVAA